MILHLGHRLTLLLSFRCQMFPIVRAEKNARPGKPFRIGNFAAIRAVNTAPESSGAGIIPLKWRGDAIFNDFNMLSESRAQAPILRQSGRQLIYLHLLLSTKQQMWLQL